MMRRRRFTLVPSEVSHETLDALRELVILAESGELIGVAFAAMYKGKKFIVCSTGEMRRSPTFARGALRALDDELSAIAHGHLK